MSLTFIFYSYIIKLGDKMYTQKESKFMLLSWCSLVLGFILLIFGNYLAVLGVILIVLSLILVIISEKHKDKSGKWGWKNEK